MLALLSTFWKPLAILGVILGVAGGVRYYGHTEYKKGYEEAHKATVVCKAEKEELLGEFEKEISKWQAQVKKQKEELAAFEKLKEETIQRSWDVFKETKKKVTTNKKATDNEIKATIRPADVVVVPGAFVSVYNHAVEGSRATPSNSTSPEVPGYSGGVEAKSVTFGATYFTEVVKGNVDEYNLLASRCNALIDIVINLENIYGTYAAGPDNTAGVAGGNLPIGATGN